VATAFLGKFSNFHAIHGRSASQVKAKLHSSIIKQMCWLWNDEKVGRFKGWKRFLLHQVNSIKPWNLVYHVPNEYFNPLSFALSRKDPWIFSN
jgi:hypothetical protein